MLIHFPRIAGIVSVRLGITLIRGRASCMHQAFIIPNDPIFDLFSFVQI